jgi:hypothetical protein
MDYEETVSVTLVKENEDGSAVYQFDFSPEALEAFTNLGILTAIKAGINEARKLSPDYPSNLEFTDEIKELAKEAGFVFWSDETSKPDNSEIDWSSIYDDDLVKFYHLVRERVLKEIENA